MPRPRGGKAFPGLLDIHGRIKPINPKAELRNPKEFRNPKAEEVSHPTFTRAE
jgi:hypothetical protein